MQVEGLSIERRPSYDSDFPNQLVGLVTLKSNLGSQQIRLTTKSLSRIFEVITEEVCETAKENAARTKNALVEATHEPLLAGAAKVEVLE